MYQSLRLVAELDPVSVCGIDSSQLKFRGDWIPSKRGLTSVTWSVDDIKGIRGWLVTNFEDEANMHIELAGVACKQMTSFDVKVNKFLSVKNGDALAVVYNEELEYAIMKNLAIVTIKTSQNTDLKVLIWQPEWYSRLPNRHPIRDTILLKKENSQGGDWISAADAESPVTLVHSCKSQCLVSLQCDEKNNQYELLDGDSGVKLDLQTKKF